MLAISRDLIMKSVDLGTDYIYATDQAFTCLKADWNRVVVDLNRGPDEMRRLGVVATMDFDRRELYRPGQQPDQAEIQRRLEKYYWPYHHRLAEALEQPDMKMFFDCHSLVSVGPAAAPDAGIRRADVVLGNNAGPDGAPDGKNGPATCSREDMEKVAQAFRHQGLKVAMNTPYRGGYITRHYGAQLVAKGGRACQIEINEGLYTTPGVGITSQEKLQAVREKVQAVFQQLAGEL
jgi:N-formylglutamate amidohydrolase